MSGRPTASSQPQLSPAAGCPGRIESIALDEACTELGPVAEAFTFDQQLTPARPAPSSVGHPRPATSWLTSRRDAELNSGDSPPTVSARIATVADHDHERLIARPPTSASCCTSIPVGCSRSTCRRVRRTCSTRGDGRSVHGGVAARGGFRSSWCAGARGRRVRGSRWAST